jgi:alpha-tubulin suppressor-like RCC1 family protein
MRKLNGLLFIAGTLAGAVVGCSLQKLEPVNRGNVGEGGDGGKDAGAQEGGGQSGVASSTRGTGTTPANGQGGTSAGGGTNLGGAAGGVGGASSTVGGGTQRGTGGDPCSGEETRSCSLAGAQGPCAAGTQTCTSGTWGPCSTLPAPRDTCVPGNDANCNGTPNDSVCKVVQIAAGTQHTCALLSDGMVRCWGANGFGQLGDGSSSFSVTPRLISGLVDVQYVAAGARNSCAINASGSVSCWGDNYARQLGNATAVAKSSTPVLIDGLRPASSVSVGEGHICTVASSDGSVQCWGNSEYGRLGNGTVAAGSVSAPSTVSSIRGATSIAAGRTHSCATLDDSSTQCWGENSYIQLGSGAATTATPTKVVGRSGYPLSSVAGVFSGGNGEFSCGLLTYGEAECWGRNNFWQVPSIYSPVGTDSNPVYVSYELSGNVIGISSLAVGETHACAVLADKSAVCWGNNTMGQLGTGAASNYSAPTTVALANVASMAAGALHTCAVLTDGSARCWGHNITGQLGDETVAQRLAPVKVLNLLP